MAKKIEDYQYNEDDEYEEESEYEDEEQSTPERKKDLITSSIFIAWFMTSISIFVIASFRQSTYLAVINFGQFFLVLNSLVSSSIKDKISLVILPIGLGCIIIPILMMIWPENVNWQLVIATICLIMFNLLGLVTLFTPIIKRHKRKKECSLKIQATIDKQVKTNEKDSKKIRYTTTYTYTYKDKEYKFVRYDEKKQKLPGSRAEIRIDPEYPESVLEPINDIFIFQICAGICLTAFMLLISFLAISQNF